MLVISSDLVLSPAAAALPPGTPRILWDNIVTAATIEADSEAVGYPVANLADPATDQFWKAAAAVDVEIVITVLTTDEIAAVGLARHNFGSAGIAVEVGYYDTGPVWVNLAGPQMPADDEPMLAQFTSQSLDSIVIKLAAGDAPAQCAVVSAGPMLIMERGVDVGNDYAVPRFVRQTAFAAPRSEAGDYLGRIVTSRYIDGVEHTYSHLTADFFRDEVEPFIAAAQQDSPFFYAMRADDGVNYDVAYAWLTDDPAPMKSPATGRYKVGLKMGGIVG